ncbi:unnamed protein product [Rotaria sp. Silwood2]|nr:unnamed protein product [Rotaria sp. Silwood2]CAF3170806.1 unnamed protein product [Rotaria sp. Silwood2]CAF3507824.1 unnamed protein product [Rotaria sp. Silwood2]CAF4503206.1 unnamed protein product [Rotaria sp. Silwood2]CAF4542681.1 unnamed protein product [Rotaria sp. Silwood2]
MSDQQSYCRPDQGVPPYLLCRKDPDPSLYSDGASRIFDANLSMTSAKDTDYLSVALNSHTISSLSIW